MGIQSFRCSDTAALYSGGYPPKFKSIAQVAERKLQMLDAATQLLDLSSPPGNRLEKLGGDRSGSYSIRINQQWRLCFKWGNSGPTDVEIIDYH